jgi:hypothetical protein
MPLAHNHNYSAILATLQITLYALGVEVYSIHYVIKFVSDLWQVGGFLHQ